MLKITPIVNNESGLVIVVAIMILAVLMIIGISSSNTSITEVKIATSGQRYKLDFYVADSGCMIQTADTLKYLYMGGRIGRAQHLVGSLLNVKPIIGMEDGIIIPLGQARTRTKAYTKILELMHQRNPADKPIKVAITHIAVPDQAELLLNMVKQEFDCRETLISQLSPVLGVHAGPGLVGVNFYPVLSP